MFIVFQDFEDWGDGVKYYWNKKTLEGRWFFEDEKGDWFSENLELNNDYTEKSPPCSDYVFDEELSEWVLPEPEIIEDEND